MAQILGGYFIALGDDPRNPGYLLIVNEFKLLRFLKMRVFPDMPPYVAPELPPVRSRFSFMQALFGTPGPVGGGIHTHALVNRLSSSAPRRPARAISSPKRHQASRAAVNVACLVMGGVRLGSISPVQPVSVRSL